ncbi:MAG: hypothetical protein Q9181_002390 [Wetmoreana brouardii]
MLSSGISKIKDQGRGVDICIGANDGNCYNISNVHAILQFHLTTGVLLVKGGSHKHPLILYGNDEPLSFKAGDSHVVCSPITRLSIGKLDFLLRIPRLGEEEYQRFAQTRDEAFGAAGRAPPDARLYGLPCVGSFQRVGPIILHKSIANGGYGWVMLGVHYRTGDPLIAKVMHVGGRLSWKKLGPEDTEGLLQAQHIECERGCVVNTQIFQSRGDPALSFCCHAKAAVYFVCPAALKDLSSYHWDTADLSFIVDITRDVLRGLKAMHEKGWIHRDVSLKNILIMSESPTKAVLTDFGKAIHAETASDTSICPMYMKAPEVNGEMYSNKIDSRAIGLVLCAMLVPEDYAEYYNRGRPQG